MTAASRQIDGQPVLLDRLGSWFRRIPLPVRRRWVTPTVFQMEALECGAASLAMILAYHGLWVPLEKLREACGVSRDGSKASNVLKAARRFGLTAKGFRKEPATLHELPMPSIIHWNFNHFVVLERLDSDYAYINDPATGRRKVGHDEFDAAFTGVVLAMEPGPDFKPGGREPDFFPLLLRRLSNSLGAVLLLVALSMALVVPTILVPAFAKIFVDDVLTAFPKSDLLLPEEVRLMADIKRFVERWRTDKDFRDTYPHDPEKVGRKAKLRVGSEIVHPMWDNCELYHEEAKIPPALQRFYAFERGSLVAKYEEQRAVAKDARFESWRKRQVHRVGLEAGVSTVANPHIAASLELSRGCSVGCWFCSANPPRLGDVFRYTTENARLWRGILDALWDVLGPTASQSICYSGTDPFDNIDYERFADDFGLAYGTFPYTSTALAVRDVERTRRLMARSDPYQLRFSVLSVGMLDKIHAAFTPEEMLYVRVDPRNAGSLSARQIHFAGRARERVDMYRKHVPGDPLISTPSCETGFKFNLSDRVIRLSSPCAPDERWPHGYRIYAERNFTDAEDARRIMLDMISEYMPTELPRNAPMAWHHMLRFEPTAEGFKLVGPHLTQRFNNSKSGHSSGISVS